VPTTLVCAEAAGLAPMKIRPASRQPRSVFILKSPYSRFA
jgi:hypothetical protein